MIGAQGKPQIIANEELFFCFFNLKKLTSQKIFDILFFASCSFTLSGVLT